MHNNTFSVQKYYIYRKFHSAYMNIFAGEIYNPSDNSMIVFGGSDGSYNYCIN